MLQNSACNLGNIDGSRQHPPQGSHAGAHAPHAGGQQSTGAQGSQAPARTLSCQGGWRQHSRGAAGKHCMGWSITMSPAAAIDPLAMVARENRRSVRKDRMAAWSRLTVAAHGSCRRERTLRPQVSLRSIHAGRLKVGKTRRMNPLAPAMPDRTVKTAHDGILVERDVIETERLQPCRCRHHDETITA